MQLKKYIFYFLLLFFVFLHENLKAQSYDELKKKYENIEESDERAFGVINVLIAKAKKEKNNDELMRAYEDAIYYSSTTDKKLIYADSSIAVATKTLNNDFISRAYLVKGTIYYFNLKKYKSALDEYMKAYEYSKKGSNDYQKSQLIYYLGVVKSYLGYLMNVLLILSLRQQEIYTQMKFIIIVEDILIVCILQLYVIFI